jgi:hypothetical protein
MITIRLGGVPEHFNLPIHLALEAGHFEASGIHLEWSTFHGGTGQMTDALGQGKVDACIVLTEGMIKAIIAGNPSKIISGYVNTPLIWGIHTGTKSTLRHHNDIYDKQYAISRFGSGSHLMAVVDAALQDKKIGQEQWQIVGNLNGALESLERVESDVFYWEKYTTKPYVDNGQLRRIGEFVTPWPCFVVAATDVLIHREPAALINVLSIIHRSCRDFMLSTEYIPLVADRYGQQLHDAERWYHATEWATHGWVSDKMLKSVVHNLQMAELIDPNDYIPDLVWKR